MYQTPNEYLGTKANTATISINNINNTAVNKKTKNFQIPFNILEISALSKMIIMCQDGKSCQTVSYSKVKYTKCNKKKIG